MWVPLLLLSLVGTYFSGRSISGWHQAYLAREIGQKVFQPGDNNRFATQRMMLLLAKHTDAAMDLEPYALDLLRDHIVTYANLSVRIKNPQLANEYQDKAFEAAMRFLSMSPYDINTHRVVAAVLQVPDKMAMEHIGKAIALDPANLSLYEDLKRIALPAKQFDQALSYYEYYIPRFYNQKMNEDYAYIGKQAKQEERVINTLGSIDLSKQFTPGSAEIKAAEQNLEQLIEELQHSP